MLPHEMFPSELMDALRKQAQSCEDSERCPETGVSTFPKETTLEWAAADQIKYLLSEIRMYESLYYDIYRSIRDFDSLKENL